MDRVFGVGCCPWGVEIRFDLERFRPKELRNRYETSNFFSRRFAKKLRREPKSEKILPTYLMVGFKDRRF